MTHAAQQFVHDFFPVGDGFQQFFDVGSLILLFRLYWPQLIEYGHRVLSLFKGLGVLERIVSVDKHVEHNASRPHINFGPISNTQIKVE